eukprot:1178246-Prorocentrum_minimum.AAC.2
MAVIANQMSSSLKTEHTLVAKVSGGCGRFESEKNLIIHVCLCDSGKDRLHRLEACDPPQVPHVSLPIVLRRGGARHAPRVHVHTHLPAIRGGQEGVRFGGNRGNLGNLRRSEASSYCGSPS